MQSKAYNIVYFQDKNQENLLLKGIAGATVFYRRIENNKGTNQISGFVVIIGSNSAVFYWKSANLIGSRTLSTDKTRWGRRGGGGWGDRSRLAEKLKLIPALWLKNT